MGRHSGHEDQNNFQDVTLDCAGTLPQTGQTWQTVGKYQWTRVDLQTGDFQNVGNCSNGRHEIEYYRFKDFDEPYSDLARARLAGMTGQLSTRMGTAFRHAGHFLRFRRVARKLILLVTDG